MTLVNGRSIDRCLVSVSILAQNDNPIQPAVKVAGIHIHSTIKLYSSKKCTILKKDVLLFHALLPQGFPPLSSAFYLLSFACKLDKQAGNDAVRGLGHQKEKGIHLQLQHVCWRGGWWDGPSAGWIPTQMPRTGSHPGPTLHATPQVPAYSTNNAVSTCRVLYHLGRYSAEWIPCFGA